MLQKYKNRVNPNEVRLKDWNINFENVPLMLDAIIAICFK